MDGFHGVVVDLGQQDGEVEVSFRSVVSLNQVTWFTKSGNMVHSSVQSQLTGFAIWPGSSIH